MKFVNKMAGTSGDVSVIENAVLTGHTILLLGQAGTGKTLLTKTWYYKVLGLGKRTVMTAMSGIASTLLPLGSTLHSFFGLMDGRYSDRWEIHLLTASIFLP